MNEAKIRTKEEGNKVDPTITGLICQINIRCECIC